jgi:hypothetical protein
MVAIDHDDPERADQLLADEIADFYADPYGHVMFSYPWGVPGSGLEGFEGPDQWAKEFLIELGEEIKKRGFDGVNAVDPIRFSTASGHGIGKSCLTAWIIRWIMDTRPNCQGTVTANTSDQLRSKTWAELAKWHQLGITRHWYTLNAGGGGSLNYYRTSASATWRVDAHTCEERNSEAFAGQHAADSTSFYIFDEASGVPDKIWEVREGGLTDGEPMSFDFGNPTRNSGRFHQNMVGRTKHRYIKRSIDSREVKITNKELIKQWAEDYGEDSDFFKVRVRGVFPSSSLRQFISTDDVDAAMHRQLRRGAYDFAPKIIGVDPAWTGEDEFVIVLRQGLYSKVLGVYERNDDDVAMAQLIGQFEDDHQANAVFVDGGYGTGIVSIGAAMGRDWQVIWFSGKSVDQGCFNKRAEMWNAIRLWLKDGGCLEEDDIMRNALTGPELVPRVDGKIHLESKEDMRKRGLASPDRADALGLTFALPVAATKLPDRRQRLSDQTEHEYEPL